MNPLDASSSGQTCKYFTKILVLNLLIRHTDSTVRVIINRFLVQSHRSYFTSYYQELNCMYFKRLE